MNGALDLWPVNYLACGASTIIYERKFIMTNIIWIHKGGRTVGKVNGLWRILILINSGYWAVILKEGFDYFYFAHLLEINSAALVTRHVLSEI
jgi:hypothetical protein